MVASGCDRAQSFHRSLHLRESFLDLYKKKARYLEPRRETRNSFKIQGIIVNGIAARDIAWGEEETTL